VIGLKEADAKKKIADAACAPGRVVRKYSTKRPKGRVLAQRPGHDFLVDAGTKVDLTISKGKKPKHKHKPKHKPKHSQG
jgi:beta-lactam-binding protein with PASTA domain